MEEVQGDDNHNGKLEAYVSFSLSYLYSIDAFMFGHEAVSKGYVGR